MNLEPPPDHTPRTTGPYSRLEAVMICLCLLTPGSSVVLFQDWVGKRTYFPVWEAVLYGSIAATFLACSCFAGYIHAQKSGREKRVPRSVDFAFQFLLIQLVVAPLVIVFIKKWAVRN